MGFELTEVVLGSHDTLYEKCARICESWISIGICVLNSGLPLPVCKPFEHIIIIIVLIDVGRKKYIHCNYEAFLVVNPSDFIYQSSHCRTSIGWSTLQGPETSPARCSQQCTGQFDLTYWTIHHPQAQRGPTLWI